eukprot:CAMPEP_0179970330 /NCGR_PEP_ID=MMETSP0983-20121128/35219_1 /TAXON_ID=483367 /ORGANISM="non described non described, Strain CCMP 2436" /LENGTH=213 /DNA_ID=CAMNT_0021884945 /DNA_START=81 /DNA_END=721 /DNA_ORIENTATION=-
MTTYPSARARPYTFAAAPNEIYEAAKDGAPESCASTQRRVRRDLPDDIGGDGRACAGAVPLKYNLGICSQHESSGDLKYKHRALVPPEECISGHAGRLYSSTRGRMVGARREGPTANVGPEGVSCGLTDRLDRDRARRNVGVGCAKVIDREERHHVLPLGHPHEVVRNTVADESRAHEAHVIIGKDGARDCCVRGRAVRALASRDDGEVAGST